MKSRKFLAHWRSLSDMYYCTVESDFSSAHYLRNYRGKCENMHGHNYRVITTVRGDKLDDCGMLIDFKILKSYIREITDELDHRVLNDLDPFIVKNPSAENIAAHIYHSLGIRLHEEEHIHVDVVSVYESSLCHCSYRED